MIYDVANIGFQTYFVNFLKRLGRTYEWINSKKSTDARTKNSTKLD